MMRFTALLVVALALGCGSGSDSPSAPGASNGSDGCGDGEKRDPSGTCRPLVVDGDCPAGTRAALGHADCQPVGWQECGEGFERDPSGWGCAAVLLETPCTGASREALGQTACVPLGDCNAAFPPAGAKLFVSPSGPVDATHFHRIQDAIAASKSGDVIAVDTGVYPESITITKNVTIAGRCAERVKLDGAGTSTAPGIVAGASAATVRGVSIVGWATGADVEIGSMLFEDVLFEHNSDLGISLLDDVSVKLVRSVVRNTYAREGDSGIGAQGINGAKLEIAESVFAKNEGGGVLVGEAGSNVIVDRTVFRDNESDQKGLFGLGLNITASATGKVTRSAFLENRRAGLRAGPKTKLEIEDTVVRGTRAEKGGGPGMGFFAMDGATVTATRFGSYGSAGPAINVLTGATVKVEQATLRSMVGDSDGDLGNGVYVFEKGKIELVDSAIVDATAEGIAAFDDGTSAAVERTLIASTRPAYVDRMGIGMVVARGAAATVTDSSFVANLHSGVYLFDGGTVGLAGVLVRGTKKEIYDDRLGHGLFAQDAPQVMVERSMFDGNLGIGIALAASPAVVKGSVVRANNVGIHVQEATLREAPEANEVSPGEVIVTLDTSFVDNGTRVGSGALALPDPLPTKKP